MVLKIDAFLFDDPKRIAGTLSCQEGSLFFEFHDFQNAHLSWSLPFSDIIKVEPFKLYGIAYAGIVIFAKNDKKDILIMENPEEWRKIIQKKILNFS